MHNNAHGKLSCNALHLCALFLNHSIVCVLAQLQLKNFLVVLCMLVKCPQALLNGNSTAISRECLLVQVMRHVMEALSAFVPWMEQTGHCFLFLRTFHLVYYASSSAVQLTTELNFLDPQLLQRYEDIVHVNTGYSNRSFRMRDLLRAVLQLQSKRSLALSRVALH
jgi:hypothetical protein